MSLKSAAKFEDVHPALSKASLLAIESFGFKHMTPVQASTIPLFLNNKDVLVEATTGSGKTLAFGIPIIEILSRAETTSKLGKYDVGALVLAPTRELASQIFDVLSILCTHSEHISCAVFVGGTPISANVATYSAAGGQIVVGTPGRVLDMINRNGCPLNIKKLEVLVLDEADTLLDMGFTDTINRLFGLLPKQRRTGLFSATQTREVKELARAGLRNPVSVSVRVQHSSGSGTVDAVNSSGSSSMVQQAVPSTLENSYIVCSHEHRPQELANFILQHASDKIIVFCATCACVDFYSMAFDRLAKKSLVFSKETHILGFHGKMVHKKRTALYQKFVQLPSGVLFCTDVAARGVDIPDVDWIVQLAAPKDPAFFVHRVGRTARAGKKGGAVLFVAEAELPYVELLRGRGVPLREQPSTVVDISTVNDELDGTRSTSVDSTANGTTSSTLDDAANGTTSTATASTGATSSGTAATESILEHMKKVAMTDRVVLEAGSTAFMSFLRAYKEHLCSYIFRFDSLDIGAVARSYALLRLPKIPETRAGKGRKPINFEVTYIDTSTIPYQHKEKEQARQRRLAEYEKQQQQEEADYIAEGGDVNDAQSFRTWKSVKSGKSAWLPAVEYQKMKEEQAPEKRKRKQEGLHKKIVDEWDDLAAEEMAYKKFKRGLLSKEEYENCLTSDKRLKLDPLTGQPLTKRDSDDIDDNSEGGSDGDVAGGESGDSSDVSDSDGVAAAVSGAASSTVNSENKSKKKGNLLLQYKDDSNSDDDDSNDDDASLRVKQPHKSAAASVSGSASVRTGVHSHKSYTKSVRSRYSRAGSATSQQAAVGSNSREGVLWKRRLGSSKSNASSSSVRSLKPLKKVQRKSAAKRKR